MKVLLCFFMNINSFPALLLSLLSEYTYLFKQILIKSLILHCYFPFHSPMLSPVAAVLPPVDYYSSSDSANVWTIAIAMLHYSLISSTTGCYYWFLYLFVIVFHNYGWPSVPRSAVRGCWWRHPGRWCCCTS